MINESGAARTFPTVTEIRTRTITHFMMKNRLQIIHHLSAKQQRLHTLYTHEDLLQDDLEQQKDADDARDADEPLDGFDAMTYLGFDVGPHFVHRSTLDERHVIDVIELDFEVEHVVKILERHVNAWQQNHN